MCGIPFNPSTVTHLVTLLESCFQYRIYVLKLLATYQNLLYTLVITNNITTQSKIIAVFRDLYLQEIIWRSILIYSQIFDTVSTRG